jgi:uncharacterized DUF497 family protein
MQIAYDPEKRAKVLAERGLDFDDAVHVFAVATLTVEDDRRDYGETRFQTMGWLDGRLIMVVWTERGATRHIISMRRCNEREEKRFKARMDRPG